MRSTFLSRTWLGATALILVMAAPLAGCGGSGSTDSGGVRRYANAWTFERPTRPRN